MNTITETVAVKGDTGAKGQKGQVGAAGFDGHPGPPGPKGLPGDNGNVTQVIFTFDTAHASTLPLNGLFSADWDKAGSPSTTITALPGESVIDLRNNNIYMFTPGTAGNWSNLGALIQGAKGFSGDKGERGEKGTTGEKGADGVYGVDGQQGPRGPAGFDGPTGAKGDKGPAGAAGAKGDLGPMGPTGANGTDGTKGAKGEPGFNGRPGVDGEKGATGAQGLTGAKGEKGIEANASTTARAVAYFDGTTASPGQQIGAISNHGFSRIEKIAVGRYRCTFNSPVAHENFVAIFQATGPDGELREPFVQMRSRRSVTIETRENTGSHTPVDSNFVNIIIFVP